MRYLYDGHLGSMYTDDELLGFKDLYCEQCGDSDRLIGSFETLADFWSLLEDECSIDGSGGWSLQYVYPFIIREFDLPDDARYENDYESLCGFCSNSDTEIIARIKELIKQGEDTNETLD